MAITRPEIAPPWGENISASPDIVRPSDGFIQGGWPLTAIPPSRGFFNWILKFCANGIRYVTRTGVSEWDAGEAYVAGDIVRRSGYLWQVLASHTAVVGTAPDADQVPNWIKLTNTPIMYGTGLDGNHTVAGTEELSYHKFYENLFIPAGTILNTNGWSVRVRNFLKIESGGYLQPIDEATLKGENGSAGATGKFGGSSYTGDLWGSQSGGNGGNPGVNGSAPPAYSAPPTPLRWGGSGGAGSISSAAIGGLGGSVDIRISLEMMLMQAATFNFLSTLRGGAGGGGGAGGTTTPGAGGGAGGPPIAVFARNVWLGEGMSIRSRGGVGGNSFGGGGSGGGGGGGLVLLGYEMLMNAGLDATCIAGGAAGTGGTPVAGSAGAFKQMTFR